MTELDLAAVLTGEALTAKTLVDGARPSHGDIAALAYRLYERGGRQHGHDVADWLSAERELMRRYQ